MFNRKEYLELSQACGPFTLDASAADNGLNAQHTRYCCPSNSFLKADVSGECIWGCFPASRVSVSSSLPESKEKRPFHLGSICTSVSA
jgi:hypothetical protein